ncbi:MAG: TadE/TadG family type IV pilus assembly protein [Planctomycetota bacterium]
MFPLRRSRRRSEQRRGASVVEFSICGSVLFFLFFSMVEVVRFHMVRHSLDQAAYEGARAGIVMGSTATDVEDKSNEILAAAGITGATVSVTPSVINDATEEVNVQVSAAYADNSWLVPRLFNSLVIVANISLDHENVASR